MEIHRMPLQTDLPDLQILVVEVAYGRRGKRKELGSEVDSALLDDKLIDLRLVS